MDEIAALSSTLAQQQVQTTVATFALKQANAQQNAVATLLDGALELAQQIQEPGQGESVNTYA
jgi:hypothetical protein